jgi:hypothetical protein
MELANPKFNKLPASPVKTFYLKKLPPIARIGGLYKLVY